MLLVQVLSAGKIFIARTDHYSLTWLLRFKEPQGQLARWSEGFSQYHVVVKHRERPDMEMRSHFQGSQIL